MTGSLHTHRPGTTRPRMDLQCPNCDNVDAVGKASELYAQSRTTTAVSGRYTGSQGSGTFGGRAETTTHLTSKLAPPPKPFPWFAVSGAVAGLLVLVLACSAGLLMTADLAMAPVPGLLLLFAVLVGALGAAVVLSIVLYKDQRAKLPTWSRQRAEWEQRFYCRRCGVQFVPRTVAAPRS